MKAEKITSTAAVSKSVICSLPEDSDFMFFLKHELKSNLCNGLVKELEKGERIVKLSEVRAFEILKTDQIEYRQQITHYELIRCKDCKYWGETLTQEDREVPGADLVCSYWMSDGLMAEDFCSQGERREDAEVH